MTNKQICFEFLTGTAALSRAVAIGIMANIRHESNFRPTAKGDSGTSYGLCQWHKSRWDSLKTYCADNGYSFSDVKAQLRFLLYEFQRYYTSAWGEIISQPDTETGAANAAYIMCVRYEIPANKEQSGKKRGETAKTLWKEFSTSETGNVEKEPESVEKPVRVAVYTVQAGDTLTKIAYSFRTTLSAIMENNSTIKNPDLIRVGDKIKIPGRV